MATWIMALEPRVARVHIVSLNLAPAKASSVFKRSLGATRRCPVDGHEKAAGDVSPAATAQNLTEPFM
jgi:hypothetical protein